MNERVILAVVGIIKALFVLFLALFAVYEDNLMGKGGHDQNIPDATGNIELPITENMAYYPDAVNMGNIVLTKDYLEVKQSAVGYKT